MSASQFSVPSQQGMSAAAVKVSTTFQGKYCVRSLSLQVKDLPSEFHNFRLVQLTDFHFGPATSIKHLQKAVAISNDLKPDIVALTGDFIQLSPTGFRHAIGTKISPKAAKWLDYKRTVRKKARELGDLFGTLRATHGVVGTYGNHDHLQGIRILSRQMPPSIVWLMNSSLIVRRGNTILQLAGLDDFKRGKPELAGTLALEEAKLEISSESNQPYRRMNKLGGSESALCARILLSHNPDVTLDRNAHLLNEMNIVLCGHTHGGQICLPFYGPVVTHTKQRDHIRGLSFFNKTPIYVCSGVGYGGLPIRFLCPPEIVAVELCPA